MDLVENTEETKSDIVEPVAEAPIEDSSVDSVRGAVEKAIEMSSSKEESSPDSNNGRPRDSKGRFAPSSPATDSVVSQTAQAGDSAVPSPEVSPSPGMEPPASFNAVEKEAFKKAPPEVQQAIGRRIKEMESGFQASYQRELAKIRSQASQSSELHQAIAPYVGAAQRAEMSVPEYTKALYDADYQLQTNPVQAILGLMQNNGVDLQTLSAYAQNPQAALPYVAPTQDPMIMSELAQLRRKTEEWEQARAQAEEQKIKNQIESWGSAKDAQGNLLRPHFQQVRKSMSSIFGALFQQEPGEDLTPILEKAYRAAVGIHPDIAQSVLQAQIEAETQKRNMEQKARVEQARKAGISLKGNAGGAGNHSSSPDTVKAAVLEAISLQH